MEMHRCKKRSRRTLRSFCSLLSPTGGVASGGGVDAAAAADGDGLDLFTLLLGI